MAVREQRRRVEVPTDSEEEEEEVDDDNEEEEEEKEKEEASEDESEEENEGTSKGSAASDNSDDEQEKNLATCNTTLASCSPAYHGTKRKFMISEAVESKDEHTLSWVPNALAKINSVDALIVARPALSSHPSPAAYLPDLERVRGAAMALVKNSDAAISFAKAQQNLLDRKVLEEKVAALRQELAQSMEQSKAEHLKQDALLQQTKAELLKQSNLFQTEKESLTCSHKLEREALIDQYTHEQRDLRRQLEEERDKSICCVCHDKPRDTIILPCLHFQYCFPCLLRHREANSNTCPTCRGPIQGLSMSSYLATQ